MVSGYSMAMQDEPYESRQDKQLCCHFIPELQLAAVHVGVAFATSAPAAARRT